MYTNYFDPEKINNIEGITSKNRDLLFVEVNQKDLIDNIFNPIKYQDKFTSHFFPKRFAILGDFKTGKSELGKLLGSVRKLFLVDTIIRACRKACPSSPAGAPVNASGKMSLGMFRPLHIRQRGLIPNILFEMIILHQVWRSSW